MRVLLTIMGGDDEAALASHAGSWLELLVSELLHLRPNTQARQHLLPLLQHCQGYPLTSHAPGAGDQPDASDVLTLMGSLMEVRGRGAGARLMGSLMEVRGRGAGARPMGSLMEVRERGAGRDRGHVQASSLSQQNVYDPGIAQASSLSPAGHG